jgi:ribonuclease P protein component
VSAASSARKTRLSRAAEFDRVFRSGRSAQHRFVVLYCLERPAQLSDEEADPHRVGLTVSKRVGSAVSRNAVKRALREQLRASERLRNGVDYVAIARPGVAEQLERHGAAWLGEILDELLAQLHKDA